MAMAFLALETIVERRGDCRVTPAATTWMPTAVLRPGQAVVLLNISRCGALVESSARLQPGLRTALQLASPTARRTIRGRLERCHVACLAPLRYRGAVVFDQPQDLAESPRGS